MKGAVIVIDIGMTNKKVLVYDENLVEKERVAREFSPVMVAMKNGEKIPAHDLRGMWEWFQAEIKRFAERYPVKAVSVSTHGATFVCVDENGEVCAPCVFYTHEPGKAFHDEFYQKCGSPESLQRETLTPRFSALMNAAQGVFFLQKYFAEQFQKTRAILQYPQYWSFLLTGKKAAEPTSLGCHSYLWNQNARAYSTVADALGIKNLLPSRVIPTCSTLGAVRPDLAEKCSLGRSTLVTAGIHDSNASLLPYFARESERDFVLNSTGSWCVCMHPAEQNRAGGAALEDGDIGKTVFFNRSALDTPVKTAIFAGGLELDAYVKLYQKINRTDEFPASDFAAAKKIIAEKNAFVFPGLFPDTSPFPHVAPGVFEGGTFFSFKQMEAGAEIPPLLYDAKAFWACLDVAMAIQTEAVLEQAGIGAGADLFVEGGFRKNNLYMEILASILPQNDVFVTDIREATALGAAICAVVAADGKTIGGLKNLVRMERRRIEKHDAGDYKAYKAAWLSRARREGGEN